MIIEISGFIIRYKRHKATSNKMGGKSENFDFADAPHQDD
ncbi:hypothetical protein SMU88_00680 [Streptococcus mutans NLML8]|nr:hypothetical protein SMU88_00680 [Streptococcus mutans NLML8]